MGLKNFVLLTYSGEGIGVAKKLGDEGVNCVVVQIENNKDILTRKESYKPEDPEEKRRRLSLGDGLVKKIKEEKLGDWLKDKSVTDTFIFTDFSHCFKSANKIQKLGFLGMYPTEEDRLLEVDRQAAKDFVEKNYPGISLAETQEFKKVDDALKFLEGTDKAWVLKGCDEDCKTVVPDTDDPEMAKEQLEDALEGDKTLYEKSGFVLEEKIPEPVEITPEALFWDGKPLAYTVDLELKRFGAGDTGPMTGCAADLVFPVEKSSKIVRLAFPSAVLAMAKKHKGMFVWDASLLFSKDKPYFGEFCANRVGYNAFFTELELTGAKSFFEAVMEGKNPYSGSDNFAASIRIFNVHKEDGRPASEMEVGGDLWGLDLKEGDEEGEISTSGYLQDIGVVTGKGGTVEMAAKRAALKATEVNFREKYYRPLFDLLSKKYKGSIVNRYMYGVKKKLW